LVPSLEVASRCSATRFDASNLGGCRMISLASPVLASASHNDGGTRKLVTVSRARSSVRLVSAMPMVELSGRASALRVQLPLAPGR
jgi:hypothetical protein